MTTINVKCKHCGNNMAFDTTSKSVTCPFCGSTYQAKELLDEKDLAFIEKLKPDEIEDKIEASSHIKTGEALLYQARFVKAELEFKKAISIDPKNYHAYFGMVKAKTHNFSILPEGDGYKEYAKSALKYVPKDDQEYLKNEISKLDLLEIEHANLKQMQQKQKELATKKEHRKRKISDLLSTILYFLIFVATAIGLIVVIARTVQDERLRAEETSTIEISTAAELSTFMTKKEYLSATIILKNDINFNGELWTPVGTSTAPFTGKFFGQNHTISNIKIADTNHDGENYIGLFGFVKDAKITGIKLSEATVSSTASTLEQPFKTTYAGIIVARANNSEINLCEISNSCSITVTNKSNNNLILGGIIGYAKNSKINNCASHANITGQVANVTYASEHAAGGVVGKLEDSGLTYSYSSATIYMSVSAGINHDTINLFVGGVVGTSVTEIPTKFYINFCYFTGNISAENSSENKIEKIAGIVASPANLNNLLSNFALFDLEKYNQNQTQLSKEALSDIEKVTYFETEAELIAFISENYTGTIWENTNSITPTLKTA